MKTIQRGERIPFGLSKWEDLSGTGWQLLLPVLIWHCSRYDIGWDAHRTGWWKFGILVRREHQGVHIHWGWGLVKETSAMVPRYPL